MTTRRTAMTTKKTNLRSWRAVWTLTSAIILLAAGLALFSGPAAAEGDRVVVEEGESIQGAIDAADPGTTIVVRGDHEENIWINKSGIRLIGRGATLTPEADPAPSPCDPAPGSPAPLICVTPASDGPPAPANYLDGVVISGFQLDDSVGHGVAAVFTSNLEISRNAVSNSACHGILVIFNHGFRIERNSLQNNGCNGVEVGAADLGIVRRNIATDNTFNGIGFGEVSHATIRRNVTDRNCIGIVVADTNDDGFGVRAEPYPGRNIRIVNNQANDNTRSCPFGPATIGQTGIAAGGITDVVIRGNTATGNGGDAESLTSGGVMVADFPNLDGTVTVGSNARVIRNTASGNYTARGPADLVLVADDITAVRRNTCGFGVPDPAWCG